MEETNGSKGLSIAALVLGIISMLCCCIGFPFAIVGLILAIIALVKKKNGKGLAIAGLITSLITLVISTITAISIIPYAPYFSAMGEMAQNAPEVIEEYEEDGTLPDALQDMVDDGVMSEENAKIFMDSFCQSYSDAAASSED